MNYNYYELEPKNNHFYSVVIDITHKCNMKCANCYIPNRNIPDMDLSKLIDCIKQFPKRTEIRIIGAEPTMRKDLTEVIKQIRKCGHRPMMISNGLKLGNKRYAQSLFDAGLKTINLSLNGADDDKIYLITDQLKCADRKMKALKNCAEIGYFININTILMKGVNDFTPLRLAEIVKELNVNAILRFRNVGQIGRYSLEKNNNWTFNELKIHISNLFKKDVNELYKYNKINGYVEKNVCFFPIFEGKIKTPWIKITDWSPDDSDIPDPNSKRRGRITQNFKIAPFFEHVKINEYGY